MDSTHRFSNRVEDYHRHRPGYPNDIIHILQLEGALPAFAIVADVGSGTGKLTQMFFKYVDKIYGVEPNLDMRRQAEKDFVGIARFISVNGSAESTTLHPASIDLVCAGQAFHWFDRETCRGEFKRILKPEGWVALVWNLRDVEEDQLQQAYEHIMKTNIPDYKKLDHKTMTDDKIKNFFCSKDVKKFILPNFQYFDLPSLKGRVLSSSYVPRPPDPVARRILEQVAHFFQQHQQSGRIKFVYKTTLYLGQLN
ncbi:class I SAM-dependent methyltransferase [candidate division KSB1 bacterium]|nr:class I SAM-dependent methyltransferase [candidate division KSB1 bacterium]